MTARAVVIARQATITRAVDHLRTTDPATLATQLATTGLHDHWKTDPAGLADNLELSHTCDSWPQFFGAWKGAQQVLHAAGLPH